MIAKKYEFLVFSFFMSLFMSILMSGVITFINIGLVEDFAFIWLEAFCKAFVVAFPAVLVVVPQVRKIVKILVRSS
ncbi:MAG: hypothetical protein CR967_00255 [Proteobacteria bacterium]|nr:MAG: hypothetical protein CR967_00255 [Pseudomonadota bacterium]